MCGIAGIVQLSSPPERNASSTAILDLMLDRMSARGPDERVIENYDNVGFGFGRLSIVDLADGHQPMKSRGRGGQLVQMTNGEIYNHEALRRQLGAGVEFRSRSDAEVILPLYERYGRDYVEHVNGMFGTAILDRSARKLLLVRDRLGIKPLYFHRGPKHFVFASEIKAVLAHPEVPRSFDWTRAIMRNRAANQASPDSRPESYFEGIESLAGGEMLELCLDTGEISIRRYWNPRQLRDAGELDCTRSQWIEQYRDLLADSVRLRLMADVEYGLFLSGGIDSISIAQMASRHSSFHTFSVLSQSTLGNGDAEFARIAADQFGLANHQVYFDWRETSISPAAWRHILWQCEMHECCAEQYYKYQLHAFARRTRPELKVILLGQGSDEFNGGYTKGQQNQYNSLENPSWASFCNLRREQQYQPLAMGQLLGAYSDLLPMSLRDAPPTRVSGQARPSVLRYERIGEKLGLHRYESVIDSYFDRWRTHMQMYQLWHEDRTAAANSVENRVPFLDHRVVEHLHAVPAELHEEFFWDKRILREAMAELLPPALAQREKVPFFAGEDERFTRRMMLELLRKDGDELVEQAIAASDAEDGPLDGDLLRRVVREAGDDPQYSQVDEIVKLVNMGLLAGMAKDAPASYEVESGVEEMVIDDWTTWRAELDTKMIERSVQLSERSVLRFADEILLVRCESGAPDWIDEGGHYIIRGTQLEYVIEADESAWARFLSGVNGQRNVAQILEHTGLARAEVWQHLEDAVERNIVVIGGRDQSSTDLEH